MANVFLNSTPRDTETAIMLDRAIVTDIGNAVAYTDGKQIFVNTDDNLDKILPAYDHNMLKWLLWHERFHMELSHHHRFFTYLHELDMSADPFRVTKSEVNIIMDILVHDSLSKMFPDLVETAVNNLAQMRNRNSLKYTFKTFTLEEMLDEYKAHKKGEDEDKSEDTKDKSEDTEETEDKSEDTSDKSEKSEDTGDGIGEKDSKTVSDKAPKSDGGGSKSADKKERTDEVETDTPDEHDKTDWSKLEGISEDEFITEAEAIRIKDHIEELKRKRVRLAQITQTLNGLATGTRKRTYAKPSTIQLGGGAILKGSIPGKAKLYLVFDASGSMGSELRLFKDIIQKSIPQALNTPTTWFSGWHRKDGSLLTPLRDTRKTHAHYYGEDLYTGKFKDILDVSATSGYSDDGDRTIELCWLAEQQGYSPIGVTDGGGRLSWSTEKLKQLKRTVIVGPSKGWLKEIKRVNPNIQTIDVSSI